MTLREAGNRLAEAVESLRRAHETWPPSIEPIYAARADAWQAVMAWREAVAQQEDDGK